MHQILQSCDFIPQVTLFFLVLYRLILRTNQPQRDAVKSCNYIELKWKN